MKFPKRREEEKSASEIDLDLLQESMNMSDEEFRQFLQDYGFASD